MHVIDHFDAAEIRRLDASGEFFWLDLDSPTDEQLAELGEILGLPPLAVEDSQEFGQRAEDRRLRRPPADRLLRRPARATGLRRRRGPRPPQPRPRSSPCTGAAASALDERARAARALRPRDRLPGPRRALGERSARACARSRPRSTASRTTRSSTRPRRTAAEIVDDARPPVPACCQVIVPQRDMLATGADAIERVLGLGRRQAHHSVRRHPRRPRAGRQPHRLLPRAARRGAQRLPLGDVQPAERDRDAADRARRRSSCR